MKLGLSGTFCISGEMGSFLTICVIENHFVKKLHNKKFELLTISMSIQ